jgi:hypothetical protein
MGLNQPETTVILDLFDLLIGFAELHFSVLEKMRITDHVPFLPGIVVIRLPSLRPHPPTGVPEWRKELADDEIIRAGTGDGVATNVANVRGTKRLAAFGVGGSETHPPPLAIPRSSMTGGEDQIPADENASAGPQGAGIVVIGASPNLANGAMGPDVEAFILMSLEDVFHWIVVVRFEHTEDVGAFGFVGAFWFVLLGDCTFSEGKARRFVAFGDFEATFFYASLDLAGIETALRFAALVWRNLGTVGRAIVGVISRVTVFTWCVTGAVFRCVTARGIFRNVARGIFGLAGVLRLRGIPWLSSVLGLADVFSRFAGLVRARLRRIVDAFRTHSRSEKRPRISNVDDMDFTSGRCVRNV